MRKYETMFILKPNTEEENRNAIIEKFKNIISDGGEVISVDDWGLRKLAYEIQKVKDGYYYLVTFNATNEIILELERNYRIMDAVMRFIVINLEEK